MTRSELRSQWDRYCKSYIPKTPEGFSPEAYLFDAELKDVPETLAKQMDASDKLVRLDFHNPAADRGLGTLERSRDKLKVLTDFLNQGHLRMAFNYELGTGNDLHIVDRARISDRDIWFIGDVHGDLLALRSALAYINSNSARRPVYVFLGDLFDRNPFGLNVLMEVVELLKDSPDSVFLLAGNHDDGLAFADGKFFSRIQPHQFADELNDLADDEVTNFVKAFIGAVRMLPIGLLLPNGLFATHGGIPSRPERSVKNLWTESNRDKTIGQIHSRRSEFLNNRFQKDVVTGTKISPEFSWMEVVNFSEAVEVAYGVPVRAIVRGHDHCDLCRHDWGKSAFKGNDNCPPEKAGRVRTVLTMTSMVMMDEMERNLPGFLMQEVSFPTIAHYNEEEPVPQVYSLMFDAGRALGYVATAQEECKIDHARALLKRRPKIEREAEETAKVVTATDEQVSNLQAKLGNTRQKGKESEESLESARQKERKSRESLVRLEEEANSLHEQEKTCCKDINELNTQIANMEKRTKRLREQRAAEAKRAEARRAAETKRNESENLRAEQGKPGNTALTSHNGDLTVGDEKGGAKPTRFQGMKAAMQAGVQAGRNLFGRPSSNLDARPSSNLDAADDLDELEKKRKLLADKLEKLKGERTRLVTERENKNREIDSVRQQLKEAEDEVSQAQQMVDAWGRTIAEQEKLVEKNESHLRQLRADADKCQQEVARCRQAAAFLEGVGK